MSTPQRTDLTLVVMAAGASRRYGTLKQIEPVGPSGETLLEYSVFDALHAGFNNITFIIRREIEDEFKRAVGHKLECHVDVNYLLQDDLSPSFAYPRDKPWGTGYALLLAASQITNPFGIINADDFYGREAFDLLAKQLRTDGDQAALIAFLLQHTLSGQGGVSRGICELNTQKQLVRINEVHEIKADQGAIYSFADPGQPVKIEASTLTSVNTWGFKPGLFKPLLLQWQRFIADHKTDIATEFYLPSAVADVVNDGVMSVTVVPTDAAWFGLTYAGDKQYVTQQLIDRTEAGVYPVKLWD